VILSSSMHSLLVSKGYKGGNVSGTITGNIYNMDSESIFLDMHMNLTFSVDDHYAQEEIVLKVGVPTGCFVTDMTPKTESHPRTIQQNKEFDLGGTFGVTSQSTVSLNVSPMYKQTSQETLTFEEWTTSYSKQQDMDCVWTLELADKKEFPNYPLTALSSMTAAFTLTMDITEFLKGQKTPKFSTTISTTVKSSHSDRPKEKHERRKCCIRTEGWSEATHKKPVEVKLEWEIQNAKVSTEESTEDKVSEALGSVSFMKAFTRLK